MAGDKHNDEDLTDDEFDAWIAKMRIPEIIDARRIEESIELINQRMADEDRKRREQR
jgi:hypothetical protein